MAQAQINHQMMYMKNSSTRKGGYNSYTLGPASESNAGERVVEK
jgi:hypothetical protein